MGVLQKCGIVSLNFIRLLRVVITPSVTSLMRGENDSKQSDEFQVMILSGQGGFGFEFSACG